MADHYRFKTAPQASTSNRRLLPALIDGIATAEPGAVYAECPVSPSTYGLGFRPITYRALANAINGAAWFLEKNLGRGSNFETLAYIGSWDIRYVIMIMAGIKAGYKMFLDSPRNSIAAHISLFSHLKCRTMVTTSPRMPCVTAIVAAYDIRILDIPSLDDLLTTDYPHYPYEKTFEAARHDEIFVVHTSGSTGLPKPLTYTHECLSRWANISQLSPPEGFSSLNMMMMGRRLVLLFPLFHVAGLFISISNAIYNRSVFLLPLATVPPTGESLAEILGHTKADLAFVAPFHVESIVKNSVVLDIVASKLDLLVTSGGAVPLAAGKIIAKRMKFTNSLGSSEYGGWPHILASEDPFQDGRDWEYIHLHPSIGAEFQKQTDNHYELVLKRDPAKAAWQSTFLLFPDLAEYRTNDLFLPHPTRSGFWTHRGRKDDVIVFVSGEKTNPIDFENHICKHPDISAALVFGNRRFEAGLLVELIHNKMLSAADQAQLIERLWPVVVEANEAAPAHARISKSHICFTDPQQPMLRTGKGTVQRRPTMKLYAQKIDKLYADMETIRAIPNGEPMIEPGRDHGNSLIQIIQSALSETTKVCGLDIDKDFFAVGMDSLQTLRLVRYLRHRIKVNGIEPSLIYLNPSVRLLAKAIIDLSKGAQSCNSQQVSQHQNIIAETLQEYTTRLGVLAKSVTKSRPVMTSQIQISYTVILTGSTGCIGSYILNALLERSSIAHVYCLNRVSNSGALQVDRNSKNDAMLRTSFPPDRVTFLAADLSDSLTLGLDSAIYSTLLSSVSLVIHNAWPVDFNLTLPSFAKPLEGVINLSEFCARGSCSPLLLFLSSRSAVMNLSSPAIPEEIVYDLTAPVGGYGASKYVAERLLDHAARMMGTKVGIVRIGQVTSAANGSSRWNQAEWLPSLAISARHIGAIPDSLGGYEGVVEDIDWVPVDVLSNVLIELGIALCADGPKPARVFHAVNPRRTSWSNLLPSIIKGISSVPAEKGWKENEHIAVVHPAAWLEKLRVHVKNARDDAAFEAAVASLPAWKLLEFYQQIFSHGQWPSLVTTQAEQASRSLRDMEKIKPEWIERWARAWFE